MIGVPNEQLQQLRAVVTQYELSGPNARFESGESVAERLLIVARATVVTAVSDAQAWEDSMKLDLIEKWTREKRFDLASKLADGLRAGKPIRVAIDDVLKNGQKPGVR